MSHLRTIPTGLSSITAATYLPVSQKLAVSGFSKSIKLFDITSYEQAGDLRDSEFAAMALVAWQEPGRGNAELLAVGDVDGRLSLMDISVNALVRRECVRVRRSLAWSLVTGSSICGSFGCLVLLG
jgi:hypothetical protein